MQYMYINKSNKLDYRKRFSIIKLRLNKVKKSKIAKRFGISIPAVSRIEKCYEEFGLAGLEDHKPGPQRVPLNPVFYANIITQREKTGLGACALEGTVETLFRKI